LTDAIILTPALEDYLEAILEIHEKEDVVRVTDVADRLNIAKSTVSQTINRLKKLGLVVQESYGPIKLTRTGKKHATKVQNRHRIIRKFLVEILEIDYKTADEDACLMEHVLSPKTMEKLAEFIAKSNNTEANSRSNLCPEHGGEKNLNWKDEGERTMRSVNTKALSELQTGEQGRIIRITAKGPVRRRILEMGITLGTKISIKGVAPLGDPIELLVKGYRLSLRKEEATDIFVEVLQP